MHILLHDSNKAARLATNMVIGAFHSAALARSHHMESQNYHGVYDIASVSFHARLKCDDLFVAPHSA